MRHSAPSPFAATFHVPPSRPSSSAMPWHLDEVRRDGQLVSLHIVDAAGRLILEAEQPVAETEANMRRIVASVNALRDIPTERVGDDLGRRLIKAVKMTAALLQPTGLLTFKPAAAKALKKLAGELPDLP